MDGHKFRRTCVSNTRIPVYCFLVLFCSIISLPEDFKIDKANILNQWFVKLGWFWTSTLLLPLAFSSIRVDDKKNVSLAIFRIILSSILWYVSVNFFQFLDSTTGFDISGHTFLLTFSNLLLSSEMKHSEKSTAISKPEACYAILPEALKLPLLVLRTIWDFMLLQTILYYHTILQKAVALVWAIGSWYLLHTLFYERAETGLKVRGRDRDRSAIEH